MRKFDTKIQHLRNKVLREVARSEWNDTLAEDLPTIPKKILPGSEPIGRCCVYKERAILSENERMALGGDKSNPNIIEVMDIACDECPQGGYQVTDSCRGCYAHRCMDACKVKAIVIDANQKAHIDKNKCINCGLCAKMCPFSAIKNHVRPCENACKLKAIKADSETGAASIDNSKCNECGACEYQCPFGAIADKSSIVDVVKLIKASKNNANYRVYAVVAPAIVSQFKYAQAGQVYSGIRALGFYDIKEAALGADMVAQKEAKEWAEKGFLTSSCCPAFVKYVRHNFPQMADKISTTLSPAAMISKAVKEEDGLAKVVFIGPCTAKKSEIQGYDKPYIDYVLTFEELQALFHSRDMDITTMECENLVGASAYGRNFAASGGVAGAVAQALKEMGVDKPFKPVACNGIEECKIALLKASKGVLDGNFIEGMACVGGCIGGAGNLTHGDINRADVMKSAKTGYPTIGEAVEKLHG